MYSKYVSPNEQITCCERKKRDRKIELTGFTIHYPLSLTIINTQSHLFNLLTSSLSLKNISHERRHAVSKTKGPPNDMKNIHVLIIFQWKHFPYSILYDDKLRQHWMMKPSQKIS